MRRRYIALQPGSGNWNYAVAISGKQGARLIAAGRFNPVPGKPLSEQLPESVGKVQVNDRFAWRLPARSALYRWIEFPFSDPRKIASTIRTEMAQRLPVADDDLEIYHQLQGENRALALAVKGEAIEEQLAAFDDNREPLGYLGLGLLSTIAGLDEVEDGLLLAVEEGELSLGTVVDGWLTSQRTLVVKGDCDEDKVVRQAQMMARSVSPALTELSIVGELAEGCRQKLKDAGFTVGQVSLPAKAVAVGDDLTSVACLALAAVKAERSGLNLRSGAYQLKNDWHKFKRKLWVLAALTLTLAVAVAGSAYLEFSWRSQVYDHLKGEMSKRYQQQFPGEPLVATASLQLQSKIKQLQKKVDQFGSSTPGALELLNAVSAGTDPRLSVDIQEYMQNEDGIRLSGRTKDFDSVSQLLTALKAVPFFSEVRIVDTKQAIAGSQVDFQLQLSIKAQGSRP